MSKFGGVAGHYQVDAGGGDPGGEWEVEGWEGGALSVC